MSLNSANTYEPRHCIIEDRWFDTTVVIHCSGVLDMLTAPVLEQHISNTLSNDPTAMIIDLTDIEFLACHGMRVLSAAQDMVSPRLPFSIIADGLATSRPMKLSGIDTLMTVHATLHAALENLDATRGRSRTTTTAAPPRLRMTA
jgi:anti-anti-sigma factor